MLEGLFAAIALFFAPQAEAPVAEPLVRVDIEACGLTAPGYIPPPPIMVEVKGAGVLTLEGKPQRIETLGAAVRKMSICDAEGDCSRIFITAEPDTPYADVLSTMSALKHNGFIRIGLIDKTPY